MQFQTILIAISAALAAAVPAPEPVYPGDALLSNATNIILPRGEVDNTGSVLKTNCAPAGFRHPNKKAFYNMVNDLKKEHYYITLPPNADGQAGHPACNRITCNNLSGFYICNDSPIQKRLALDTVYNVFVKSMRDTCTGSADFDAYGHQKFLTKGAQVISSEKWSMLYVGTPDHTGC